MTAYARGGQPHDLCRMCETRPRYRRSYCAECANGVQAMYKYWRRRLARTTDGSRPEGTRNNPTGYVPELLTQPSIRP